LTILIGIRCTDGVVLGADGAATFVTGNAGSQFTIRQPVRKLQVVSEQLVIGTSGSVGLGQRFIEALRSLLQTLSAQPQTESSFKAAISNACRVQIAQEVQGLAPIAQFFPTWQQTLSSHSLIAGLVGGRAELFQMDSMGSLEAASEQLPFVTAGSGQPQADPFLAFLKRVFWKKKPPTIADGVFATYWALRHAIDTMHGLVADPIQIVEIQNTAVGCKARDLREEELQEHRESVKDVEEYLRAYSARAQQSTAERAPEPMGSISAAPQGLPPVPEAPPAVPPVPPGSTDQTSSASTSPATAASESSHAAAADAPTEEPPPTTH
jgi:20S proteasome alpha/beta subunit